jgi:hypothetical protein
MDIGVPEGDYFSEWSFMSPTFEIPKKTEQYKLLTISGNKIISGRPPTSYPEDWEI